MNKQYYFYIRYEVSELYPEYTFVVRAKDIKEAEDIAKKILSSDYQEEWELSKGYYIIEITAEQLLERMLIN